MKITTILSFFFFLSCTSSVFGQCYVPNQGPINIIPEDMKSIVSTISLRLQVWVVRDDNGENGLTIEDVEPNIQTIVENFDDSDITFDYCIREIHDTNLLNNESGTYRDSDCNAIQLTIHEFGGGQAG